MPRKQRWRSQVAMAPAWKQMMIVILMMERRRSMAGRSMKCRSRKCIGCIVKSLMFAGMKSFGPAFQRRSCWAVVCPILPVLMKMVFPGSGYWTPKFCRRKWRVRLCLLPVPIVFVPSLVSSLACRSMRLPTHYGLAVTRMSSSTKGSLCLRWHFFFCLWVDQLSRKLLPNLTRLVLSKRNRRVSEPIPLHSRKRNCMS